MRQASAKTTGSINTFIDKALSTTDDIYVFVNPTHRVVVLFKHPPFRTLEKLMGLCECNVIDSTEVEDYLWDNCVVQSSIEDNDEIKLDGTKSSLANVIVMTSYLSSVDDIMGLYERCQMNVSEVVSSSLRKLDETMTEDKIEKMDMPTLLKAISMQLSFKSRSMQDFVDGLSGKPAKDQQSQGQRPQPQSQELQELSIKDVVAPPNQDVLEATTFTRAEDANQARQSKAFKDVFQKLDYISKKGLTQDQIDEKINPTKDLGGGLSMIGGKIIDENAPKKKIDKKKIRSRRVIG